MFNVNFTEDHCLELNKRYQLIQSKVNFSAQRKVYAKKPQIHYWRTAFKILVYRGKTGIQFQRVKSVLLSGFLVEIAGAGNIYQFRILCLTEIPFISEDEIKVF